MIGKNPKRRHTTHELSLSRYTKAAKAYQAKDEAAEEVVSLARVCTSLRSATAAKAAKEALDAAITDYRSRYVRRR
jgi:hypothetical protein